MQATVELADGSDQSTTDLQATLNGGEGDDLIRSAGGTVNGGEGDDRLIGTGDGQYFKGGPGADLIAGGPGYDSVDYSDRVEPVVVDLDGSADDGQAGEGDNVTPAIEAVETGSGDDVLIGASADNPLDGGPGADRIVGGGGRDDLNGGPGDDFVDGGAGTDFLYGDSVDEGAGRDELLGGAGRDQFVAGPGSDRLVGGEEIDKLYPQSGEDSIEARDAFADSVICCSRNQTSSGTAFLDARDYVESCSNVKRRGSPSAVLFEDQEASSFYSRGPTIDVGCPGDVARRCVGSLRIYVRGRLAGERGFRLARGDHTLTTNVRPSVRRLLARNRVRRLDVLITTRSDSGVIRRQRTRFAVR